jgi:undecaprenyl-diphosphatase
MLSRSWRFAIGRTALACTVAAAACNAGAGCVGDGRSGGILHLDRCDEFEANGIYSRSNQKRLDNLVIATAIGVALWEGTETPLGKTAWKSLDSMVISAITTEAAKRIFQRPRPSQSDDPDLWRQGRGNKSFPSGETAMMAAFVTPIIMDWKDQVPAVWALSILPIYMGKARTGSQAHWMSDVLVGAAVGVASGAFAARRDSPLLLLPTRDGIFVGLHYRF